MASDPIPPAVRQLIADAIDSIAELEAILLLRQHRERDWAVEEAGRRLYVSDTVAGHVLSVLTERGFLEQRDQQFRYSPGSPELDAIVAMLATAYSTQLVAVTRLVHAKPAQSVREFAKAFRLRKDS